MLLMYSLYILPLPRQSPVLDLGFDQGGGIPHQAEKGGGIWQLGGGVF